MAESSIVRSVAKAMELLQRLSDSAQPLTLTELARQAGLPKTTAFGLLNTLRQYDAVTQTADGRYALGLRLFEFGCRVSRGWEITGAARPFLEHLAAQTQSSAVLSVHEGGHIITIDQVESASALRVVSDVGGRLPAYCTSQGKVFLASMSRSQVLALLGRQPLTAWTPHTITDPEALLAALEQVRQQGYAVEDGEYRIGLRSISAPVHSVDGAVRCAVGVVGMFRSTRSDEFRQAVRQVVSAGEMLSAALGYQKKRCEP